jgi:hypothetical protein
MGERGFSTWVRRVAQVNEQGRQISEQLGKNRAPPRLGAASDRKSSKRERTPVGALFVEQHLIFVEPAGWFDGTNLLRSKFRLVIQDRVRAMRREWARGGQR